MDDARRLSDEMTKGLPESLTREQARLKAGVKLFPSLGTLPFGEKIAGRYQVEEETAASGGEADVFFCRDTQTDQKVAVKVYRGKLSPKEDVLQLLQKLSNSCLVKLLNFGTWNERFFEVMEFAAGGALTGGMPYKEEFIEKVVTPQVVEGLYYLHQHNIIHRDIKPANLFFRELGKSKVIIADYGVSSLLWEWEGSIHQSGSVKGSLDFMAPEAFSRIFGKEIDYYSLGITLLVLMTGESPLAGMSEGQKMYYHLTERFHPPQGCSERFANLIAGLLCKERRKRWGYKEIQGWMRGEHIPVPDFSPARKEFIYRLTKDRIAYSIEELGELMLENPAEAKSHIRKRLVYEQIKLIDPYLASRIDDIQSAAANMDECLVEIIYTFNPELPYRLLEGTEARTPGELARVIDRDQKTWAAGKAQLSNGMIPAWLRATGYAEMAREWGRVGGKFSSK